MFKKAVRSQARLKLAITGPSGSGKTFSALRLAKGLGGKIAVIDTENGSASLYSDQFEFDVVELEPPFTTDKFISAIQAAVSAGYGVVIIDSATHQWAGEGGILDAKAKLDTRPGSNSYTNWNTMTPLHERFKSAILQSDIHTIVTLRSKQEYILETNEKGKQAPKKVGLAPIQRDQLEYEFTTVFDVAMNHEAEVSKDRTGLFVDTIFQITEKTGEMISKWLSGAAPREPKKPDGPSQIQLAQMFGLAKKRFWTAEQIKAYLNNVYRIESTAELTMEQYNELCATIELKSYDLATQIEAPLNGHDTDPDSFQNFGVLK